MAIMENGIWKDIPGYAGIYQVGNYGRVRSLPESYIVCNRHVVTAKEKVLKQRKAKGYGIIESNHEGIALWPNITAYAKRQEKTISVMVVLQGHAEAKEKHIKNSNGVMKQKVIILDGGHGVDCAGKRSPIWGDGSRLFEWEFNRDIVRRIAAMLKAEGIRFEILVPEDNDVSLPERCRRANVIHADCGNNAVLFSVHGNAGGGTGWECHTSAGQTKADAIATVLCKEAEKEFAPDGWKMRFDHVDGDPDKESRFYILKHTVCPAVLSENFFMDTEKDCRFMMTDAGRERIAKVHYNTIKRIL